MNSEPDIIPATPLRRGDKANFDIDRLTHDGRGVARVDGKVVFVADALPGERVAATVLKRKKNHDEARTEEILTASPARVTPRCEWFGVCGGCSLQHLDSAEQLALKEEWLLESFRRIGGTLPETVIPRLTGPVWGYRRKARLGVKYVEKKGRVLVGFRERNKPYVTDMTGCDVLDARLAALIVPLQETIGRLSIRSRLPQVELAAGDDRLAIVMRVLDPPTDDDRTLLEAFQLRHGTVVCLQTGGLDTVRTLDGGPAPALSYSLPAFAVNIDFLPIDFVQINAQINRDMVAGVVERLRPAAGDRVLDLFCGLGNFSLPLARHAGEVVGIESASGLIERARANAMANGIGNVSFHVADLEGDLSAVAALDRQYDLMLIDPPRNGAAAVCAVAKRLGVRRIAYVSCHPATLARDAAILAEGGYRLQAAGVMDMFPHTAHVESMAIFGQDD